MHSERLKAIIVEDEDHARSAMESMVTDFLEDVILVGIAGDLPTAVKLIHKYKPDVVFLDIELPGFSGLQILDFFSPEDVNFEIIFTTAYSEFAIQAFQLSAIDYLLKPIQIDQLQMAIEKVKKRRSGSQTDRLSALKENLTASGGSGKIAVPVSDGLQFIQVSDVVSIKAEGAYSIFTLNDQSTLMVSRGLKDFENLLIPRGFFRPHRSAMINLHHVTQLVKKEGGYVIMSNGDEVVVSSNKRDELIQAIEKLGG